MELYGTEQALVEAFVLAVRHLDPDILVGFEVQQGSLGYLVDRCANLDIPLLRAISRAPDVSCPTQSGCPHS